MFQPTSNLQSPRHLNHVHVIVNPAAGQDEPILNVLNRVFAPHDFDWTVLTTKRGGDGAQLARQAVDAGSNLVMVYGGDGTLTDVVDGLQGSDTPLAILPGGTGNAVAEKLGIPPELEQAARLALDAPAQRQLDLGDILYNDDSHRYFLLRASIGLYNTMLDTATPELKQQYGDLAYMMAGIQTLTSVKAIDFELMIDGKTINATGHTCMIANITTIGGFANFDFAPDVDPSDGLLDVFVFDATSQDILAAMHSHLATDLSAFPQHWVGREITVQTAPDQVLYTDGESLCECHTISQIRVIPGAVPVVVPATTDEMSTNS